MVDLSDVFGVAVLVGSLAIVVLSLVLLRGRPGLTRLLESLFEAVLVPERGRRFFALLVLEGGLFLLTGVLLGLRSLGVDLAVDADLPVAVVFLAGIVTLGAVAWTAFGRRALSSGERDVLRQGAPTVLESLWMAPYRLDDPDEERGTDR